MQHKFLFYVSAGLIGMALSFYALAQIFLFSQAADTVANIDGNSLTKNSAVKKTRGRTMISLIGKDGAIYKAKLTDLAGVSEFLHKSIRSGGNTQVNSGLNPSDLALTRVEDDNTDPILKKFGKNENRKHYHFQQKVGGLALDSSSLGVHIESGHDIYALTGNVLENPSLKREAISEQNALDAVKTKFSNTYKSDPVIVDRKKVAVNPNLSNISSDQNTYPTDIIVLKSMNSTDPPVRYVVSLTDGSVLQEFVLAEQVMDRKVDDCAGSTNGNCKTVRVEGAPATGNAEIDNAYDFAGETYNYYMSKHQRDSFDNSGGQILVFVNLPNIVNGQQFCPNALWVIGGGGQPDQLELCPGLAAKDVIAHEFTHGVVEYTAKLGYNDQAGAINEGVADTFASGVDDNWTIGESTQFGAFRNLDDPTKNKSLSDGSPNPMPDKLFSQYYYCGTQDRGGIHHNMSIPTKAFYLMSVGGTFNGCTMTGIGKEKALAIWYQALTKHLFTTANFKDEYDAVITACSDLYGSTSAECTATTRSLQAVEMDQQPAGDQRGPSCTGGTETTPACAGLTNPTDVPTAMPTATACHSVPGDANGDGQVTLGDFITWRDAYMK